MKKFSSALVTFILCLTMASSAFAAGLLPTIGETFGEKLPSIRKILQRDPDSTVNLDDGGNQLTFNNVTEDEYSAFSTYLAEYGCIVVNYSVEGSTINAEIAKDTAVFTFSYDHSDGTVILTYPANTEEETVEFESEYSAKAYKVIGNCVTFGHYPQTSSGTDSTAIEWIVLAYDSTNNRSLIISRYGLDAKPYNTTYTSVTWETCTLRTWLNNDFYNKAFSKTEQSAILTTTVDNSKSQGYSKWSTSGGNNTQDKIFLLSYAEANKYFGVTYDNSNNTKSRVQPTAYAISQGAYTNSDYKTSDGAAAGYWWLRSPGSYLNCAAYAYTDGSLRNLSVFYDLIAVRPALWIDLSLIP